MKAQVTESNKSKPVVIWENRIQPQADQVIVMPARSGNGVAVEREAAVQTWSVGPASNPAVVTQVSSGFNKKSVAMPQATSMRMAA
ncbi:hypothetical protein HP398_26420 [Brevibacillus sp. HB1.4B]|uniref:Uncharacterized protein n=1 Tax=Brevibacillus porteri TaxID=2126350 RepID=A0ABX5FQZ6_9BACL|nr:MULTISPECIES: hypothetical protein [Brevibacillus]MDC0764489.1 hypothetical protein [Brevibacillus sp. AG]MED1797060.1 hypothetical protein [Brevibacillus porteri]MED2129813.1 hypothetical protein [Brevibacillus porteri]MED2744671.1 hypothetical protein [Brevibacillus porteri]MED2814464.1 hypothetical protein [Brevibacillus porteri]